MGCSQNRAEALKELQEEIKKLKEMKSKILIATDTTKEASKIYDLSDEELGFLVKKYTKEYEDLQLELQRLENLGTQESVIKSRIELLNNSIKDSEETFDALQKSVEAKKQEYIKSTEKLNLILQESSKLSLESRKIREEINQLKIETQENTVIEEKVSEISEKLLKIQETDQKINENNKIINDLESEIGKMMSLIDKQNTNHQFLINLDDEINNLKSIEENFKLKVSEVNYAEQLRSSYEDLQKKIKLLNEKIFEAEKYDIEDKKSLKQSYLFIRKTLRQDVKEEKSKINPEFVELLKLKKKKSTLENNLERLSLKYDKEYENITFKLQKKQVERVSLETQLKEFKEIAGEIEFL